MADMAAAAPTDTHIPLRPDPWRIAWTILTSNTLLAFALLALALLLSSAAWLPQAPDSTNNPMAFSRWRAETQVRFGTWFAPLRQIGFFSLEHNLVLRALLALVTLCLIVRLVDSIRSALPGHGGRAMREGHTLSADLFPLADAGRIAIYLGALLIVTGLVISNAAGWRVSNLTLGVGQIIPVGRGTSYSLRLDSFDSASAGQVALLRETELISEGRLTFEQPMHSAGLTIFINGKGPAIRASATFTDGRPLGLQTSATSAPASELVLLLTQDEPDRFFAAPDAGLVIQLSRGTGYSPPIRALAYRAGAVISESEISPDGQLNVENVALTFGPETYAVLDVVRDPGAFATLAGMVVLALGLALASVWPIMQRLAPANSDGKRDVGDATSVQTLKPTTGPTTWQVAQSAGSKIALATLSAMGGVMVVRSLARDGTLWPVASAAPTLVAAWLTGCAAIVWPHRILRWATLALAAIVVVAVLIWPSSMLPPSL